MCDCLKLPKYSFSKVSHYYSCPYSFYKKYFEEIEEEGHGASEFGGYVHRILEMFCKKEIRKNSLAKYYKENFEKNVTSTLELCFSRNFSKDFKEDYYNSGLEYLKTFDGFKDWKILEVECNFEEPIENKFIMVGKIDLVVQDKDKNLIICDHKSKKKFNSKKEKKEYLKQLYLYSYYINKKYGKFPDKLVFNMFRNKELVYEDFDLEEYNNSMSWMINSVEEIENCIDFYSVKDTFYCLNFCGYRNIGYKECL